MFTMGLDTNSMLPFSFHKTIPANLSLVCNTDGVHIFKSSKYAIWPVWLAINELPPSQRYCICCFSLPYYNTYTYGKYITLRFSPVYNHRFSRQNMLLAGLWYAQEKTSFVPRPRSAFRHFQYGKAGEGLV